jgi:hypothetical protein
MAALLPLLLEHWRGIAVGVLLLAALTYRGLLVHQRNTAMRETEHARVQLAEVSAREALMQATIERQNQAVSQLKQRAEAEQERADEAARKAAIVADESRAAASAISKQRVPGGCEGAFQWLADQGARLGTW